MSQSIPRPALLNDIRPLSNAQLDEVRTLIRVCRQEGTKKVNVRFLADVVQEFPCLTSREYRQKF